MRLRDLPACRRIRAALSVGSRVSCLTICSLLGISLSHTVYVVHQADAANLHTVPCDQDDQNLECRPALVLTGPGPARKTGRKIFDAILESLVQGLHKQLPEQNHSSS